MPPAYYQAYTDGRLSTQNRKMRELWSLGLHHPRKKSRGRPWLTLPPSVRLSVPSIDRSSDVQPVSCSSDAGGRYVYLTAPRTAEGRVVLWPEADRCRFVHCRIYWEEETITTSSSSTSGSWSEPWDWLSWGFTCHQLGNESVRNNKRNDTVNFFS